MTDAEQLTRVMGEPVLHLVPPFSFYAMARANLQGAVRIATTMRPEQRDRDTCIQFLLGFVAEGYFKAYLAFTGVKQAQLRSIGHDLVKAREKAIGAGLPIEQLHQLRFVVEKISIGHLKHYYRYLPDNPDGSEQTFSLIMPLIAFEAFKNLDEVIFPFLLPEINQDLVKQGKSELLEWPGLDGLT